jgi:hypothetical protein
MKFLLRTTVFPWISLAWTLGWWALFILATRYAIHMQFSSLLVTVVILFGYSAIYAWLVLYCARSLEKISTQNGS